MFRRGALLLILCTLPPSLVACGGRSDERAGDSTYKTAEVKKAFARHGMPLVTLMEPGDPTPTDPILILSGPGDNERTEDIRVFVSVFPTSEAGRKFQSYSSNKATEVGDLEKPDLIFGEGNVVVWYDTAGTEEQLEGVKAALEDLAEHGE